MEFWNLCLKLLAATISSADYDRWISALNCKEWDKENKVLVLTHANLMLLNTIEKNFGSSIQGIVNGLAGQPVNITYQAEVSENQEIENEPESDPNGQLVLFKKKSKEDTEDQNQDGKAVGLLPSLTFSSFVEGPSNSLAFAATQRIAECPGTNYNPLFIYGGVGLGKTHLMHAVGNKMLQNNPNCKILCVSAQNFMNDFTTAVRENTYDQFNNKYHNVDALFIDDVQYLCGDKRQIQNKLFEAFEKLVPYGKQIIFTSDTYARSLKAMDERLISRFTSGLSVEVEPPELETRAMILQKKAMANNFHLPDDVAFFIAKHLKSNVRELEGALQRLMAYHMFRSAGPVTVEMAREALHSILISSTAQLTVERIQGVVAEYFKISLADMYSKRRLKSIVVPRQIAMYLCKELTKSSLPDIGDRFGKRDHTTVLHAVQKITADRKTDSDLNYKIHVLEQMLKN